MPIETIPLQVWFVPQVLDFGRVVSWSSLRRTQDMAIKSETTYEVLDSPFCNLRQLAGELAQSVPW